MDTAETNTITTKTWGVCTVGDELIDPICHEIKYPIRKDGHTVMFLTKAALQRVKEQQ